jgi:hypothetical protein
MSAVVTNWRLHRRITWTWAGLARAIGPVIKGWMSCYGRYYRSALYPLLSRINQCLRKWL